MGVQVTFDYPTWAATYAEIAPYIDQPTATGLFNQAVVFHANDGTGPVNVAWLQSSLLNMLVAHLAVLEYPTSGPIPGTGQGPSNPPSDLVGRVNTATEGSVSIGADYGNQSPNAAWYLQTKYGAMYWQATAQFRTMQYRIPYWPYGPSGVFGYVRGYRGRGY